MLGTYGSFLLVLVASSLAGQAILVACGERRRSWLAPAIGLAALAALSWGTVRLPGQGSATLGTLAVISVASAVLVWRRSEGGERRWAREGVVVAALALALASLPFVVEGRFGILGTGLNPDMSQHLFAADRLADAGSERLASEGYPLAPHAIVVALGAAGIDPVEAFDGLTLATAVATALAALVALGGLGPRRRIAAALLVGFAYMVASYLIQGAFKETMQALFVLAFAVGLGGLERRGEGGQNEPAPPGPLAGLPLAVIAAGSAYVYSFPGLLWLAGTAGLWAVVTLGLWARRGSPSAALRRARDAAPAAAVALAALAILLAPEAGRMAEFARFETFDPNSTGLGNLFNPISPLEGLGIWPSGDFRLDPGAGAAPALAFHAGAAVALLALAYGLAWWCRRGRLAVPCALAVAVALYLYAHVAGTPYQEAKAIALIAPLAMMIAAGALLADEPLVEVGRVRAAVASRRGGASAALARIAGPVQRALAVAFVGGAAACSALALVNGPVGPSEYSPQLNELRPRLERGSTLALADDELLAAHGRDYLVWELRGGRVCVAPSDPSASRPPAGVAQVVTTDGAGRPPFQRLRLDARAGPYAVWDVPGASGPGPCPFVADAARADPAAADGTRAGRG